MDETLLAGIEQAQQAIELSMEHQRQQAAEDAQPLPRNDEARLAVLLGRAGRRSARREVLNFSADDDGEPGPITAEANCGYTDPETGLCIERYHDLSCGSVSDGETTRALTPTLASGARAPYRDGNGRTWVDQHGKAVTVLGALEAASGQRPAAEPCKRVRGHRPAGAGQPAAAQDLARPRRRGRSRHRDTGRKPGRYREAGRDAGPHPPRRRRGTRPGPHPAGRARPCPADGHGWPGRSPGLGRDL